MTDGRHDELSRRAFLWRTGSGAAALGLGTLASPGAWAESRPADSRPAASKPTLPYGKLGRTGYPVTLVSFGGILLKGSVGTRVLQSAIDRGINLVHTSANYGGGASIAAFAELFKAAPAYREKVFLCVKSFRPEKEDEIDAVLRTLGVDHADVCLTELHSPDPRQAEAILKQQDSLKKRGKARHTGFVCHGDMNEVLELVVEKHAKDFDVALLAMRLVPNMAPGRADVDPEGQRFLKHLRAMRKAGIGILSMKSGARKALTTGRDTYLPHLKAYLEAGADSVLTSVDTLDQVETVTALRIKSPHLTPDERRAAADFHDSQAGSCRMCAACAKVCPRRLPVNDLMRFRMYHEECGWSEHARAEYAALGVDFRRAAECGDCSACAEVCPVRLAGPAMVRQTAELLA
ncbi:MAG: aldo/keto reductase [Planctomycetes bacterium]|nr:aldo/keto reductase [Planctomycetota bacterium]